MQPSDAGFQQHKDCNSCCLKEASRRIHADLDKSDALSMYMCFAKSTLSPDQVVELREKTEASVVLFL